jgi:acyl dehydratase
MQSMISLKDLGPLVGTEIGLSGWTLIDQAMIDRFAEVTDDHQFIHVDPIRAAKTPFGGTIAHGFLTLSLISGMAEKSVPSFREQKFTVNYGFDKVRMVSPVRSGKRVRGHFKLADVRPRGPAFTMITYDVSIEIEDEDKPALTALWIVLIQFDPE